MELERFKKYSAYLPSKQFTKIIGACALVVIVFFAVTSIWGSHGIFNRKGNGPLVEANGTVSDLLIQDSNNNGIADWEESLWGLDPKGDGAKNKAIIDQKKLSANGGVASGDTSTNETDKFSQTLLSTILALRQSGSLTEESLAKIAASVADGVDAKHTNAVTYSRSDMTISSKSPAAAKAAYAAALKKAIDQYAGVGFGNELTIIAEGLNGGGAEVLKELQPISDAYIALAKKIIAIPTPAAVTQNALDLANATAQMGASLAQAQNIYTDAITGMVGIDDYAKANTLSENAAKTLKVYFAN